MLGLQHILDTAADGFFQDWTVLYSGTGYAAVFRESADTTYIQSDTLNDRSDFACGNGSHPELGFVSALTVHYRVRSTDTVGAPDMLIDALRGGVAITAGTTVAPLVADGRTDGEYRIDVDAVSAARFIPGELDGMGIMVQVTTAPTNGHLEVSRLWLEIEWTLSPEFYDPVYHAALPDAVLGDMTWSTTGAQAAALVGTQLRLTDASAVDHIAYSRTILAYGSNYITEVSTRFNLTGVALGFNYMAASVDDASYLVELCCFTDAAGDPYVGLTTGGLDHDDPAAYLATYAVDWTNSHHYRLLIDRDADPGSSFNVKVFVDYDEIPVVDVSYFQFTGTTTTAGLGFGTGDAVLQTGQIVANVDFLDWWHYRKSGSNWRYWYAAEEVTNLVSVCTTDPQIVKPVTITPPGITTGQSPSCCALEVQDLTTECSVRTYFPVPSSICTYDVTLDYRIDTFAEAAKLSVQRTSDHYYWNEGGAAWQAAAADVAVPYAPNRTRTTLMTNILTPTPDRLIIKARNDVAAAATHTVYIYKVDISQ